MLISIGPFIKNREMGAFALIEFDIIERLPTVQEFNMLRMSVGWTRVNEITVKTALNSSIYSVCAVADNKSVGIARVQ